MKRIAHGTANGYRMHQHRGHRGVEICDDCREAWNAYCAEVARKTYDPAKRRARYLAAKARGYYDRKTAA